MDARRSLLLAAASDDAPAILAAIGDLTRDEARAALADAVLLDRISGGGRRPSARQALEARAADAHPPWLGKAVSGIRWPEFLDIARRAVALGVVECRRAGPVVAYALDGNVLARGDIRGGGGISSLARHLQSHPATAAVVADRTASAIRLELERAPGAAEDPAGTPRSERHG